MSPRLLPLACAACAPIEGTYRLESVTYTWDPSPATYTDDAFAGDMEPATVKGVYANDNAVYDSSTIGTSYDIVLDGYVSQVIRHDGALVMDFGTALLSGEKDGDAWLLTSESVQVATTGAETTYGGGYSASILYEVRTSYTVELTSSDEGFHGEGRWSRPVVTTLIESDEWDDEVAGLGDLTLDFGFVYVVDEQGEVVRNAPDRDDCEGDTCEVTQSSFFETYLLSFDAVRVR